MAAITDPILQLLRVRAKPGTASTYYSGPLVLYTNHSLSTTSTTSVSLATFSLPANALSVNGQAIRITVRGRWSGGTPGINPDFGATFNVRFGATDIVAGGGNQENLSGLFEMSVTLHRTGAATQIAHGSFHRSNPYTSPAEYGPNFTTTTPAETLSGAITIDFRATAGQPTTGTGTAYVDSIVVEHLATY